MITAPAIEALTLAGAVNGKIVGLDAAELFSPNVGFDFHATFRWSWCFRRERPIWSSRTALSET